MNSQTFIFLGISSCHLFLGARGALRYSSDS